MGIKGDKQTVEAGDLCGQVVDFLAQTGEVTSKKMFGGYGIFENGLMFALVNSKAELFFKVGGKNRHDYEKAGSSRFGKMPYWEVPKEVIDNDNLLLTWAHSSIEVSREARK